ncbi:MAG: NADH-quinone oxidoreductase subunit J family protein [Acidimicrobiia bacterium]
MEAVLFFVFAAAALVGALGVVLSRNPVHSALFLIMALVSVAIFFVLRDAPLLAAVQIIVYAGAIVVLFLFVIMLLGVDRSESLSEPLPFQRPIAVLLGVFVLVEIFLLAGRTWSTGAPSVRGELGSTESNVETVARNLFTDFLWPFEITAGLLVIAVVGGVVLARRSGQRPGIGDDARAELEREEAGS